MIKPMIYATIAVGTDRIMIESHINPKKHGVMGSSRFSIGAVLL